MLGGPFWDVNGDRWVTPEDILAVVNVLNQQANPAVAGEGESQLGQAVWESPRPAAAANGAAFEASPTQPSVPVRLAAAQVDPFFGPVDRAAEEDGLGGPFAATRSTTVWDDALAWELEHVLSVMLPNSVSA